MKIQSGYIIKSIEYFLLLKDYLIVWNIINIEKDASLDKIILKTNGIFLNSTERAA